MKKVIKPWVIEFRDMEWCGPLEVSAGLEHLELYEDKRGQDAVYHYFTRTEARELSILLKHYAEHGNLDEILAQSEEANNE